MWFIDKDIDNLKFDFSDLEKHLKREIRENDGRWTMTGEFCLDYSDKKDDGTVKVWFRSANIKYIPLFPY